LNLIQHLRSNRSPGRMNKRDFLKMAALAPIAGHLAVKAACDAPTSLKYLRGSATLLKYDASSFTVYPEALAKFGYNSADVVKQLTVSHPKFVRLGSQTPPLFADAGVEAQMAEHELFTDV
jgi:hypothetical protein